MKKSLIILILWMVLIPACVAPVDGRVNSQATATRVLDTALPVVASPPVEKSTEVPSDGAVITFERSGGLAGREEKWLIYGDGGVVSSDGNRSYATPDQVADLLAQIAALDFFGLEERYMPKDACCDRFTYRITVTLDGKTHSITALEAEPSVPQAFWDALQAVEKFIAMHSK